VRWFRSCVAFQVVFDDAGRVKELMAEPTLEHVLWNNRGADQGAL